MKISYNWLQSIIEFSITPEKLAEILTKTGLEVTKTTCFDFIPQGLLLGEIVAVEPHPNADKLKLTTVDIGRETPLTIVCGAPNVEAGKKVIVAMPGTILNLDNKKFQINTAKIRGIQSQGMLCTEKEIGVGACHSKLMTLQTKQAPGTPLAQVWKTPTDFIFDIDITPNRNDAISHKGVARDIAAVLRRKFKTSVLTPIIPSEDKVIQVTIKDKKACPHYTSVIITGVKVRPSPMWLQCRLRAIGVQPINNIVDITNFLMFELGQPLHAFDYDSIKKKKIIVGYPEPNTEFMTLDGVTRTLTGEELMIRDGDDNNLAMAGIIGGEKSKITAQTQNIFLESAYFSPEKITRTLRKHQIQTESSFRFERGTDPALPFSVLQKAASMILKHAGGKIASQLGDQYTTKLEPAIIPMTHEFITNVIGQPIPKETTLKILQCLEIGLQNIKEESFTAVVPNYRRDVTRPIDLVEEILRIYSLDKIKPVPPTVQLVKAWDDKLEQRTEKELNLKKMLAAAQFQEIYTNSIVDSEYDTTTESQQIKLENPLGHHLDSLRKTLLFGGLKVLKHNLNRKQRTLKLFEVGKVYLQEGDQYQEKDRLGICVAGDHTHPHWSVPTRAHTLMDLQQVVHRLLAHHGIKSLDYATLKQNHYENGAQLMHQGIAIANLGQVKPELLQTLDMPNESVFFAEVNLNLLLSPKKRLTYQEIPKSLPTARDISFVIDRQKPFSSAKRVIENTTIPHLTHWQLIDTYTNSALGKDKMSYTLRLYFQHPQKTLQEKEVKSSMDKLALKLQKTLQANIR